MLFHSSGERIALYAEPKALSRRAQERGPIPRQWRNASVAQNSVLCASSSAEKGSGPEQTISDLAD